MNDMAKRAPRTRSERDLIDASFKYEKASREEADRARIRAEREAARIRAARAQYRQASARLGELDYRLDTLFPAGMIPSEAEPWLRCFASTLEWRFSAEMEMSGESGASDGESRHKEWKAFKHNRAETIRNGLISRCPSAPVEVIEVHASAPRKMSNAQCAELLGVTADEWLHYRWRTLKPKGCAPVDKVVREEANARERARRERSRRALGKPTAKQRSDDSGVRLAALLKVTRPSLYNWAKAAKDEADFIARVRRHCAKRNFTVEAALQNTRTALTVKFYSNWAAGRALSPSGPQLQKSIEPTAGEERQMGFTRIKRLDDDRRELEQAKKDVAAFGRHPHYPAWSGVAMTAYLARGSKDDAMRLLGALGPASIGIEEGKIAPMLREGRTPEEVAFHLLPPVGVAN